MNMLNNRKASIVNGQETYVGFEENVNLRSELNELHNQYNLVVEEINNRNI